LAFSSKGCLEEEDLEVVEAEKRLLEAELARWENARKVEELRSKLDDAKMQINDYIASIKKNFEQSPPVAPEEPSD